MLQISQIQNIVRQELFDFSPKAYLKLYYVPQGLIIGKAMCVVKPSQDHDQHLQRHVKTENERGRENHRTPDVTKMVPAAARS